MPSFASSFNEALSLLVVKRAGFLSFCEKPLEFEYHEQSTDEINEISSLLDTFMDIAMNPHRKSEPEEIVLRSELSASLTPEQFHKTSLEPSFWRKKGDGDFAPEYVYGEEYGDSLLTYENEVALAIFDGLKDRLSSIEESGTIKEGRSLERLYQSPLAIFPEAGPISQLENSEEAAASYLSSLSEEGNASLLSKAVSKARRLSLSSFVRFLERKGKKVSTPFLATNILIHDPRYNRLYRYYLSHLSDFGKEVDEPPYAYFAYRLLKELLADGYRLAQEPTFKWKDGKIVISAFAFNKDGFLYHCKVEEKTLRVEILYRGAISRREIRLYGEFKKKSENLALLRDSYVIALKNASGVYEGILEVNPEITESIFPRLFKTLSLVLPLDGRKLLFCPVCGAPRLLKTGKKDLTCLDCHSQVSLLGGNVDPAIWIKGIRGR